MKLFEVFGEVALKGAEAVGQGLAGVTKEAESVSKRMEEVGKRTSEAGASMSKWVTGPIAAVATGLTALAKSTANAGDEIAKGSRAAGLSTDAYQELSFALGQVSDVTDKQANMALQGLNRTIGDAAAGNEKAIEQMQRLGFSAADIAKGTINAEDAFGALNNALQGTKTDAEAASLAADFLGGTVGSKLGPALRAGGGDVDALRDKFKELGLGMSEEAIAASEAFNDQLDILQRQFTAATREIGAAFLPILMDVMTFVQGNVVPILKTFATGLASLFQAFSALPDPIKQFIGFAIALVAALGPFLFILGKIITVLASFKAGIVAVLSVKALLTAGVTAMGVALKGLLIIIAPFLIKIGLIVAAVLLVIKAFRDWDQIVKAFGTVFQEVSSKVTGALTRLQNVVFNFGKSVIDVFRQMPQMVVRFIDQMVNAVIQRVTRMVTETIKRLKSMYKAVVGNSIIPDMVRDVGAEMKVMADQGASEAERFNSGVQSGVSGITPPMAANGGVAGGQAGAVNVDMRYAVIRDDKDMLERMMRSGAGLTGAFA
jgi:hypothetical protein